MDACAGSWSRVSCRWGILPITRVASPGFSFALGLFSTLFLFSIQKGLIHFVLSVYTVV